ncbi:MAG: Fic family protein, partial [Nitrosotalea sp.]
IPNIIHKRILEKKKKFKGLLGSLSKDKIKKIEKQMEIEFVYNSNKIEGSALTRGETILVLQGITVGHKPLSSVIPKSLDDIQAASNHPDAMTLIKKLAFGKTHKITEVEIKSIHRLIMKGIISNAGQYRSEDISVTGAGFTPPPSYEIPKLMKNLVTLTNENPDELTPIELATQVHYDLAWIHPFSDGNGRIARLLLNFILLRNKYPFTVVRDVDRKTYLRTLRHMDMEGEIEQFTTYIARCVEQTLDVYLQDEKQELLSLSKLAKGTPYTADYLSLLARKGRIDAIKQGKIWKTTRKVISTYVAQQQKTHDKRARE